MMPKGSAGQDQALEVQARHQDAGTAADLAQDVLRRHLAVLEDELAGVRAAHPELVELLRGLEARHPLLDDEGRDALGSGRGVGLRVDDEGLRLRPVGDPHLGAVEDEAVAAALGAGAHRDDVGAGTRLGHRQRPHVQARDQPGQQAPLLLARAVQAELVDAQVRVRAVGEADAGRGPADLLHGDRVLEIAQARAAPFLLDRHAEQPELTQLRPQPARERVRPVDLLGQRGDLDRSERGDRVADRLGGLAQIEAQGRHAVGDHRPSSFRPIEAALRSKACGDVPPDRQGGAPPPSGPDRVGQARLPDRRTCPASRLPIFNRVAKGNTLMRGRSTQPDFSDSH